MIDTSNSAASTRITDQIEPHTLNAPVPEVRAHGLGPSISPNRKARRAAAARARRSR